MAVLLPRSNAYPSWGKYSSADRADACHAALMSGRISDQSQATLLAGESIMFRFALHQMFSAPTSPTQAFPNRDQDLSIPDSILV
jgi:hypothetical protein